MRSTTTLAKVSITPPRTGFVAELMGATWEIYADGRIDQEAGIRLEALIKAKKIPDGANLYLNSPGGSLVGGMAIGRIARKHDLITHVGKRAAAPNGYAGAGDCMSACSLAFLGGRFRFMVLGSRYGVHRFSKPGPVLANESALSQVATAEVSSFIQEMGIDGRLLTAMANTDASDILLLPEAQLTELQIVYTGHGLAQWTLEPFDGGLYLKGQQTTTRGTDKFLISCGNDADSLTLVAMFPAVDPEHLRTFGARSLMLDGEPVPLDRRAVMRAENSGEFSVMEIMLTPKQVTALKKAEQIGVAVQFAYGAPIFYGFSDMATNGMRQKLGGLAGMCGGRAAR
jgi:hypothetical protein